MIDFKKRLPMILTYLRFFLVIPYIIFLILDNRQFAIISFIIYILASITDWLDGFLARKFDCISSLGAFLDPLADKVLTLSAFFIFSIKKYVYLPLFLVILMFFREYFVTMMRVEIDYFEKGKNQIEKNEIKFVTSKEAKLKTTIQMVTIVVFYFFYFTGKNYIKTFDNILFLNYLTYLPLVLFSISLLLAYYSSYKYVRNYLKIASYTLTKTVATFFYLGYFPLASGTFASLISFLIFILVKPSFLVLIISIIILFSLGIYFSSLLEKRLMVKDPSIIVIDEVVGVLISMIPITLLDFMIKIYKLVFDFDLIRVNNLINNPLFYLTSSFILLILFRIYDICKPSVIKKVQKFSGGFGIIIDDIISALFAILTFLIVSAILLILFF